MPEESDRYQDYFYRTPIPLLKRFLTQEFNIKSGSRAIRKLLDLIFLTYPISLMVILSSLNQQP